MGGRIVAVAVRRFSLAVCSACLFSCGNSPRTSYSVAASLNAGVVAANFALPEMLPPDAQLAQICQAWPNSLPALRKYLQARNFPASYLAKNPQFLASVAGCQTWYELTDRNLEKTFSRVAEALPPGKKLHCLSVGFLQPWIMLRHLACERLTIVDVNPYLIAAQVRLMQAMRRAGDGFSLAAHGTAAEFPFAVSAAIQKPQWAQRLSAQDFCPQPYTDYCEQTLAIAATKLSSVAQIEFVRAPLHEALALISANELPKVFYLSNAIDEKFTTENEFATLAKQFTALPGAQNLMIYHMTGDEKFSVYRAEGPARISAVCSDRFIVRPQAIKDPCYPKPIQPAPYEMATWADRLAGAKAKEKPCAP